MLKFTQMSLHTIKRENLLLKLNKHVLKNNKDEHVHRKEVRGKNVNLLVTKFYFGEISQTGTIKENYQKDIKFSLCIL